jgi:hypothetical protein
MATGTTEFGDSGTWNIPIALAPATVSQNVSRLHDIAAADLKWSSVHQCVGNGPMCSLQDAAECGP